MSNIMNKEMNGASKSPVENNPSKETVIACHDLAMSFQEGKLHVDVLKGINLELKAGQTAAIIGTSGSGKSTLLHLLGGLDLPTSGDVFVNGKKMSALNEAARGILRNQCLGFVYQFHHLLPEFTAEENVAMPLLIRGASVVEAKQRARDILTKTGLCQRLHHKPGELSGGERQRAAISRALITQPRCLLADEPTGNLDRHTADQVFDLMMEINQSLDSTLLIVTHDNELASRMDLVMKLEDGVLKPV